MQYPISVPGVGLVAGKFSDGDVAQGIPASLDPAAWANAVTDELLNVITAASLVPSEVAVDQLLLALRSAGVFQTASQFDSTTKAATTAFVRQALGNLSGAPVNGTNGLVLTGAQAAGRCVYVTAGATITLPLANSVPVGTCIYFRTSASGANRTIQPQGGDALTNRVTTGNVILQDGDDVVVQAGAGGWTVFGGVQNLGASLQFAASLATNGYQKIPGGMVAQWGASTFSNAGSSVTFPLAFTSVFGVYLGNAESSGVTFSATAVTNTGFMGSRSVAGTANNFWLAIGKI